MPTTFGRYEHPYEHDQKLVSAFLRAGERVAFDDELPVRMEDVPSAFEKAILPGSTHHMGWGFHG